jgi:hypothetical protein
VDCTLTESTEWCEELVRKANQHPSGTLADNAPAYIGAQLLALDEKDDSEDAEDVDEESDHPPFRPIPKQPGAVWLRKQWDEIEGGSVDCVLPPQPEWELLYKISQAYFNGCIELAKPQTELLRRTYVAERDRHKAMYRGTAEIVNGDHNYDRYADILERFDVRVTERTERCSGGAVVPQRSEIVWEVYTTGRAIQHRYETFMTVLAKKSKCEYTAAKLKSPYRAIEKCGLRVDAEYGVYCQTLCLCSQIRSIACCLGLKPTCV